VHGLGSPWHDFQSPFYLLSTHGSSSPQPDFWSPFCLLFVHRLGSPQPDSQSPFYLLFMHGLGSSQLNSHSPLYATSPQFPTWSFSMCTNVLQVWQSPISKIEWSSNVLALNFLLKFFYKQHEIIF
jgi:hypothetical protein